MPRQSDVYPLRLSIQAGIVTHSWSTAVQMVLCSSWLQYQSDLKVMKLRCFHELMLFG